MTPQGEECAICYMKCGKPSLMSKKGFFVGAGIAALWVLCILGACCIVCCKKKRVKLSSNY